MLIIEREREDTVSLLKNDHLVAMDALQQQVAKLGKERDALKNRCIQAEELNSSNWEEIKLLKQRVVDMKANIANGLSQLAKIHPSIAEHIVLALASEKE